MLHVVKDIFAAAQVGDRAALERLLSQLRPDIQRCARFQCYASSSIEDVVQEALIVVYRRVGDIRSPAALGAWLVRVVARLCALPVLMFMRSVEELKTIEDSERFAYVPVDQLRMDVARALAALPDKYRQIILLRDLEELTISEIARRLTISGLRVPCAEIRLYPPGHGAALRWRPRLRVLRSTRRRSSAAVRKLVETKSSNAFPQPIHHSVPSGENLTTLVESLVVP